MANQKVKVALQAPSKKKGLPDQIVRVELDKDAAKDFLEITSGMVARVVAELPETGESGLRRTEFSVGRKSERHTSTWTTTIRKNKLTPSNRTS